MTRDKIYTTILKWFRDQGTAKLILPDGAYGENTDILQLTYITNRPRKLLIELNGQFMLVFTDPTKAIVEDGELIVGEQSDLI